MANTSSKPADGQMDSTDKAYSDKILAMFKEAVTAASSELERLENMQRAYDCELPEEWGTYSELYLPIVRTAVEVALPLAVDYLFPKSEMITLRPTEPISNKKVQLAQEYLEDYIRNKTDLKEEIILTLKDAYKLNVGYGIVETEVVTPLESVENSIFSINPDTGAIDEASLKDIAPGSPVERARYRYINWRQIIPMPDGRNPEKSSGTFFLDDVREDELKLMYEMDKTREVKLYKGNPETIIDHVRENRLSMGHYPICWVMAYYASEGNPNRNTDLLNHINRIVVSETSPVRVPILKCYFKNEHIWIAPDGTIIRHIKDDIQTLNCPIEKATPCPDEVKWYPKGDIESGNDLADGQIILFNAVMDSVSHLLHPTTIVNKNIVRDTNALFEPHSIVEVYGKVGDAVTYSPAEPLSNGILGIGQDIANQFATAVGQPRELQGQGTAGVMRGGGLAFESLLQSAMSRPKFAAAVLETGFMQKVIQDFAILIQIIGTDDSWIVQDKETKDFVRRTITSADFKFGFKTVLSLDEKFMSSPAERNFDIAMYQQVIKDNPYFDQQASAEWVLHSRDVARKLRASPEVYKKQIAMMQEQAQAQQQQSQQPAGSAPIQQGGRGVESAGGLR